MRVASGSFKWISTVSIAMLAIALSVLGVTKAHAARDPISPNKACSNGTSCFQIFQSGPGEGILSQSLLGNAVESHNPEGNGVYSETHNPSSMTKHCSYGIVGVDLSIAGGTMNFGASGRSYHDMGLLGNSVIGLCVFG